MQGDGLALDEETRFINVAIALGRDIPNVSKPAPYLDNHGCFKVRCY